jgi:hypothetical protein
VWKRFCVWKTFIFQTGFVYPILVESLNRAPLSLSIESIRLYSRSKDFNEVEENPLSQSWLFAERHEPKQEQQKNNDLLNMYLLLSLFNETKTRYFFTLSFFFPRTPGPNHKRPRIHLPMLCWLRRIAVPTAGGRRDLMHLSLCQAFALL